MPTRRRPAPLASIVLGAALVLSACDGGDGDQEQLASLRQELAAVTEAQEARDARIDALESTLERLEGRDPSGRLAETDQELQRLADTLTVLDEELAIAVTEHEQRDQGLAATTAELAEQGGALQATDEELRGAIAELRSQLQTTRGAVESVGGEVEDLRTLVTTVRDRLDRLQRGS